MTQIKFFLALLFFSQCVLLSQSGWVMQYSGTNSQLNDCFFVNDNTGFVAGMNGILLKTTNGGLQWYNCFNLQNYDITSLYFINNIGWAIINDNEEKDSLYVLKTINYGISWNKYNLDSLRLLSWFNSIQFINTVTGYITACTKVYKTVNGGLSWFVPSNLNFGIGSHFVNETTGWACKSPNGIYKTTNGGFNWFPQEYFWYHQYITDIFFIDSQKGFVLSLGFGLLGPMFKTENSGLNWTIYLDNNNAFKSIYFSNVNTGYMLAGDWNTYTTNRLSKTTNGGVNWDYYSISSSHSFNKVFFSSVNTGWVVGDSGIIMKTTNGGVTIGIQQIGTSVPQGFSLYQNYPNPFNPSTNIDFNIPLLRGVDAEGGRGVLTKLIVFDIMGREVEVLVNEQLKPGEYQVDWNAANYPSGVYYYKITAGNFTETRKMVLLK